MISLLDYKLPDGGYDWSAYEKARVDAGEKCTRCGHFIPFGNGRPSLCHECVRIQSEHGEADHERLIRCPKCGGTSEAHEHEGIYEEGTHDLTCPECEHEFEVETSVSYSFRSPERIEASEDAEDYDEEDWF